VKKWAPMKLIGDLNFLLCEKMGTNRTYCYPKIKLQKINFTVPIKKRRQHRHAVGVFILPNRITS